MRFVQQAVRLPPSGDIVGDFGLDLDTPDDTGSKPVSTSRRWSCGSTSGSIQWKGTITVGGGCKLPGRRVLASADARLQLLTNPDVSPPIATFKGSRVTVSARAFCGDPPYHFRWQIAYTEQNRTRKQPSPYVTVTPPLKNDRPGPASKLTPKLKCSLSPKTRRSSPESWLPCWSFVKYIVVVTDAGGHSARGFVLFDWQAQCVPKASRPLIQKQLEDIGKQLQEALLDQLKDAVGPCHPRVRRGRGGCAPVLHR